jgi:uncharacterized membrane protein YraQ (UPF0718 family)
MILLQDKRLQILIIFTIIVSVFFWTQSRYPALEEKANLTKFNPEIQDPLVPRGAKKVSSAQDSYIDRVYNTTISWIDANKKGMSFGVILASALLTIFRYLPNLASSNRFLNSLYGMASGAPLGICANCVAPVTKGLYESGASQQTALAMMFSSPTLNVVVLTAVFTAFPLELALLKLATTLLLILVIVPLIPSVKRQKKIDKSFATVEESEQVDPASCNIIDIRKQEKYFTATLGAVRDYLKNFVYIVTRTVPLMFVAGFLGALLVNLVDFSQLAQGGLVSWYEIIIFAFVGTFMPMPIAFDVILANSLYLAGMPIITVAILLFTLGAFSVYTFSIVTQTFSLKVALALYIIVMSLGIMMGVIAEFI